MSQNITPEIQKKYNEHCRCAQNPMTFSQWFAVYDTNSQLRKKKLKPTPKYPINGKFTCNKCGKRKDVSEFPKVKDIKRGFKSMCKECKAKYHLEYYHKNKRRKK